MILILFLITALHVAVLSKLVFFPYPELFVYPYLTNHGLKPYGQIFDQHFPGLMFLPINFNNLGMLTPSDARLWQVGIVVIIHVLLFITAKKIFKSNRLAIISNIFFFLWQPYFEGWVLWIDSFVPIFLLSGIYFLFKFFELPKPKYIFLTGVFLGVAIIFKQVVLPLAAIVGLFLFFKNKSWKHLIIYGLGVFIPVIIMILYILSLGVWNDFIFWTVTFNLGTFAEMGRKYASFAELKHLGLAFLPVIVLAFYFFLKTKKSAVLWIGTFFIFSLAFAFARYDLIHLQPSLPFAALLAPYAILAFPKKLSVIVAVGYLIPVLILINGSYQSGKGSKVLFYGDFEKKLASVVREKTTADDKIFAFATTPHIYSLADRLPSGNVFVFPFPWFFVDAQDKILEGLIKDPPKLVIRDPNSTLEGVKLISWAPKIDSYVTANYKVIQILEGTEILVKK